MASSQSKPGSPFRRPGWVLAYALAALALAASLALAWHLEGRRPWKAEVEAINQERGRRLQAELMAAGIAPARAKERAKALAAQPPRVREVTPSATGQPERCLTCHDGLEQISPAHPVEAVGCVSCHGGQGMALTKAEAHQGLLGRNPSAVGTARVSCGGRGKLAGLCHGGREEPAANMVARVESTIMATMTGVITSLRVAWGAQGGFTARYATAAVSDASPPSPLPGGMVPSLLAMPAGPPNSLSSPGLADDHWRKFCARCHLRAERPAGLSVHGQGCAACHGVRDPDGRYHGQDACLPLDQTGHAARHKLLATPPEESCRRCHNRSARVGLNFQGWMEDENGLVPWSNGNPQVSLSGWRGVRRLMPDVHAEKGMTCIDCHTGREVMGDGHLYQRMRFQTEVRCATCHGGPAGGPRFGPPDGAARYEAAYGPLSKAPALEPGSQVGVTAKGRSLAALRPEDGKVVLHLRSKPGDKRVCKTITTDASHNLPGHQRLACQACHSRWAPQCYGCHDYRQEEGSLWDYATGQPSPGRWKETRDLYRMAEPMLGVDSAGRIVPFVPGCQVVLSMLDKEGKPRGAATIHRGGPAGNGVVSTPISPHTTRTEVPRCEACHLSPRRLGLGWGQRGLGNLASQRLSDLDRVGWPSDWTALVDEDGQAIQGQTHEGARPLNRAELSRVMGFARCLPCHRRADDPVVRDPAHALARIAKGGDYAAKHRDLVEKALR